MFPFRKTPPSKVDVAKKAVADAAHAVLDVVPTEAIEEKFDDLKKSAVAVAIHAAQVAHHASEVASHKLEELQHAASAFGDQAADAAHRASDAALKASDSAYYAGESAAATAAVKAKAAKEAAQSARDSLQERAGTLIESAVALKESFQDRASHDLEAGKAQALDAKAAAENAAKRGSEAVAATAEAAKAKFAGKKADAENAAKRGSEAVTATAEAAKAKFASKKAEVEDQIAAVEVPKLPKVSHGAIEVEYTDSGAKWGWILLGLAVGALLALLFAPTSGRRSRAAIKGRLDKVTDGAVDAATATSDKVVDIANRVEGIAHKVEAKLMADAEADDDGTLADRVRSVLGHQEAAKAIERINVDVSEGVVTLRGPIVDQATQDTIVAAVKTIPGVKDVISDFLIDEPVDPATSVA